MIHHSSSLLTDTRSLQRLVFDIEVAQEHCCEGSAAQRRLKNSKQELMQLPCNESGVLVALDHSQVLIDQLEAGKSEWFEDFALEQGPAATKAFIVHMILPRVLVAPSDALFCAIFAVLLIELWTPRFHFLDFMNVWTAELPRHVLYGSMWEAKLVGIFVREMLSYVLDLRSKQEIFASVTAHNCCFHRNYYEDPSDPRVEWVSYVDFGKGLLKWTRRIYTSVRRGLEPTWKPYNDVESLATLLPATGQGRAMRNMLLFLDLSSPAFPVLRKYAISLLEKVRRIKSSDAEMAGASGAKRYAELVESEICRREAEWLSTLSL